VDCALFDDNVDDYSIVLSSIMPRARKQHKCGECYRIIQPGEIYLLEKELYDKHITTCKTCIDCKSVRDNLINSFYWGQVWELVENCIEECGDNQPWSKIGMLTPLAKQRVCNIIDGVWENHSEED